MSQKTGDRKRKAPYTAFEKALVRELVAEVIDVIESKKTDSEQSRKKVQAWQNISKKYNENPQCQPATADQIKKLWLNMKMKARDAKTAVKQRCHTGGGPYIPDPNPEDDAVLEMIPNILPTIKVSLDSDGFGDKDGDEDDESWCPIKKRKHNTTLDEESIPQVPDTQATTTSTISTTTSTTSTTTSTTSTTTSVTSTSTSVSQPTLAPHFTQRKKHQQKLNVDELKCQLIEKDIAQRAAKYDLELAHQKRMCELEYKIMVMEYEHKKKLFKLIEDEQLLAIKNAENNH